MVRTCVPRSSAGRQGTARRDACASMAHPKPRRSDRARCLPRCRWLGSLPPTQVQSLPQPCKRPKRPGIRCRREALAWPSRERIHAASAKGPAKACREPPTRSQLSLQVGLSTESRRSDRALASLERDASRLSSALPSARPCSRPSSRDADLALKSARRDLSRSSAGPATLPSLPAGCSSTSPRVLLLAHTWEACRASARRV
mmetsp:Transcript_20627/g.68230  ORF Transcript_20627/g.68230 Transcript_20627/m.68230 type:complete len:202 (-) Transcript_20627:1639-2244(-)